MLFNMAGVVLATGDMIQIFELTSLQLSLWIITQIPKRVKHIKATKLIMFKRGLLVYPASTETSVYLYTYINILRAHQVRHDEAVFHGKC